MQAFMFPETAAALLAQSRAYTETKRREKAEDRALEVLIKELGQYGWIGKHAEEMAAAHLRVTQ